MRFLSLALLLLTACSVSAERLDLVRPLQYTGSADASGAVPISSHVFAVADDEDNTLRLYSADHGGPPLKEFDCNAFLEVTGKSLEADLEAAARIGNRIFWMGSHGRNKDGKVRPNRCRFFATDIQGASNNIVLTPVGRPYRSLLDDFLREPRLARFNLGDAADRAPKKTGALNIEGLSAMPDGHLLIGFRNPIPDGKALLVPLLNPNEMIQTANARFGDPVLLDLDGLGVRDIAWHDGEYIIIAGAYHGGGPFELFRWSGGGAAPKRIKVDHLNRYNPEAIIIYPDKGLREFQILSDDGSLTIDGVPAHEVTDWTKRRFRSFWVRAQ